MAQWATSEGVVDELTELLLLLADAAEHLAVDEV
jgi:hypothetical protein